MKKILVISNVLLLMFLSGCYAVPAPQPFAYAPLQPQQYAYVPPPPPAAYYGVPPNTYYYPPGYYAAAPVAVYPAPVFGIGIGAHWRYR